MDHFGGNKIQAGQETDRFLAVQRSLRHTGFEL